MIAAKLKRNSGMILMIVIMIVIVLMIMTISILTQSLSQSTSSQKQVDQIRQDQIAKGIFSQIYSSGGNTEDLANDLVIDGVSYNAVIQKDGAKYIIDVDSQ